jgi:hypothetical protein
MVHISNIARNTFTYLLLVFSHLWIFLQNARTVLGDKLYRAISSRSFSPDALIPSLDPSQEHNIVELVNRVDAAVRIWQKKLDHQGNDGGQSTSKPHQELQLNNAQNLLMLMKHKFPGLSQTQLDMHKIQYNKDVGHSILESYSRVLESLAFNVLSRINEVLLADDTAKFSSSSSLVVAKSASKPNFYSPAAHPSGLPKSASTHAINSPHAINSNYSRSNQVKSFSDLIGYSINEDSEDKTSEPQGKSSHWFSWSPLRKD